MTLTTEKGTILPLLELRGKPYLQVAHRLVWFRERFPTGKIQTEIVEICGTHAVYRATISILNDKGVYLELASATKREDKGHFADYIEKAETAAVGRALAMCGFGTQFAPELDESDRVVDAPIEPARTSAPASEPAVPAKADGDYVIPFGKKFKGKRLSEIPLQELSSFCDWLRNAPSTRGEGLSAAAEQFLAKAERYISTFDDHD